MMASKYKDLEKRALYQAEWDKENTIRISVKLNRKTDADIIQYLNLDAKDNKAGAIKAAIREYIKRDTD